MDCRSCINIQLYCSKENNAPGIKQGSRVVNDLCQHIYNTVRTINSNARKSEMLPNQTREEESTYLGITYSFVLTFLKIQAVVLMSIKPEIVLQYKLTNWELII